MYFGVVVSLHGLQLVTFLSKLNGLDLWATDIGNAYLEAFTMEWNYIIAGPEFGQLEGHYLIIVKALYGLCMSGLRWHECFADCLCNEGFSPCKAEPDIWMRLNGNLYEYVATYVDDLCLRMLDPKSFTDTLQKKYNFKLKGTGPIDFDLGQSFSQNDDGEMEISVKCYVASETGKCQCPTNLSHFATILSQFCDTRMSIHHFFSLPNLGSKIKHIVANSLNVDTDKKLLSETISCIQFV
jgi:hypothetical protein